MRGLLDWSCEAYLLGRSGLGAWNFFYNGVVLVITSGGRDDLIAVRRDQVGSVGVRPKEKAARIAIHQIKFDVFVLKHRIFVYKVEAESWYKI